MTELANRLAELDQLPDSALVNTHDAGKFLGYATATLESMRTIGRGPGFVKLSPRRIRYRMGVLRQWVTEREQIT